MITKKITALILTIITVIMGLAVESSAKTACLSELTVSAGSNSITNLEKQGYTVLFQGMNLVTESDSAVYLGYKSGGTAITDIIVADKKANSITVENITYTLASNISLNQGTSGTPIYLYYTKDTKAGAGLASIETVTITKDSGSFDSLFNDGSSPVLDNNGKLANLEKGNDDGELYIKKIPSNAIKPYISKATLVTGSKRDEALLKAINSGYNCFLDESLSKNSYTYLAYCRTDVKSDALTGLYLADESSAFDGYTTAGTVGGKKLLLSSGGEAPLLDIASSSMFEGSFTLGDWASLYFAGLPLTTAKSVMLRDSKYKSLQKSTSPCSSVNSGASDNGVTVYGIYFGKPSALKISSAEESTTAEATTTQAITIAEAIEEDVTDILIENEKSEEAVTEETTEAEESSTISSVLGKGNITVVIFLTIAVIAAVVILTIFKKRKEQNHNETI